MATGVDPEEGTGTVYTKALGMLQSVEATDAATAGGVITPPSSIHQNWPTSATLTSEQGGGHEPPPPSQAGTPLLATNLEQRLAPAVAHDNAGTGNVTSPEEVTGIHFLPTNVGNIAGSAIPANMIYVPSNTVLASSSIQTQHAAITGSVIQRSKAY